MLLVILKIVFDLLLIFILLLLGVIVFIMILLNDERMGNSKTDLIKIDDIGED